MNYRIAVLSLALMLALAATGYTSDDKPQKTGKQQSETAEVTESTTYDSGDNELAVKRPVYKPPRRGAPAGRVGGGTRGATERESFALLVLAPDHLGYTINDRPCLYWYISKPTTYPIEVTLTERRAIKPLLEKVIKGPDNGGIQQVCLADYSIQLREDVSYKWFVTLVTDTDKRSKDILAGGMLARLSLPEGLHDKLNATRAESYFIYAEEGLWYDAVDEIVKKLYSAPQDASLRQHLAALLEQVGLGEVAAVANSQPL